MIILKCTHCNSYGLEEKCSCGHKRISPRPPKYSPDDKYAQYRRTAKYGSIASSKDL